MTVDASNVTITTITEDPVTGDRVTVVDGVETRRVPAPPEKVVERSISTKLDAALAANATFLALGAPTNAQIIAQTRLLTREVNGIIKLLRGHLADESGT